MNHNYRFLNSVTRGYRSDNDRLGIRSLVEICDQRRVLIEHHFGLMNYGDSEIAVKVSYGSVRVSGNNLKIRYLSKEKIVICGCVDEIALDKEK